MNAPVAAITSGSSHFVGFHDITPWNTCTDDLVCLRTDVVEDHAPKVGDKAKVVIVEPDGRSRIVGETFAWNWQKGARQRFVPALGRRIVGYNTRTTTGFGFRLLDIESSGDLREVAHLPRALYDVAPDGTYGLSLDMVKLVTAQPGYGYVHPTLGESAPDEEGIWRVDLRSGETRLLLAMEDFLLMHGLSRKLGRHYFTHIQISPDSRRYVFMHRCFLEAGGLINNLVVAEADGSRSRIVHDDKMSHFDWADPDTIIVWCRQNAAVKALKESRLKAIARLLYRYSKKIRSNAVRQSVYNEAFRKIDLVSGNKIVIGRGILTEDGHPQVHPTNPELWINDTYPTPAHLQTLMLFHEPTKRRIDIATLATQPSIQETVWRCDLHPRWKPSGDRVCIDSAHRGRRQVYVVDVADLVRELSVVS